MLRWYKCYHSLLDQWLPRNSSLLLRPASPQWRRALHYSILFASSAQGLCLLYLCIVVRRYNPSASYLLSCIFVFDVEVKLIYFGVHSLSGLDFNFTSKLLRLIIFWTKLLCENTISDFCLSFWARGTRLELDWFFVKSSLFSLKAKVGLSM